MSLQAEHCVQVLALLYVEFDQRSGWADREKVIKLFKQRGIAEGRTKDAIRSLKSLQMVEEGNDGASIKLSGYGVDWFEKTLPLSARGDTYEFSLPLFRSVKLVGPDEFYKRKQGASAFKSGPDWAKWSVIVAAIIGAITICIMKGWL